jgi:DNA-3-methyladenine glycosylase
MPVKKLPESYFLSDDVVATARNLLGKKLVTCIKGIKTSGIITETEAYAGVNDKGSHAYGGKRTKRNEVMYHRGGIAYIYLCYGMHPLFNIVTNTKDVPHAVLIRAIYPVDGKELILLRRNASVINKNLFNGPGKVTRALGLDLPLNGEKVFGKTIWVEDQHQSILEGKIFSGPRIGIDYAGEDALLPYRFWINWKDAEDLF